MWCPRNDSRRSKPSAAAPPPQHELELLLRRRRPLRRGDQPQVRHRRLPLGRQHVQAVEHVPRVRRLLSSQAACQVALPTVTDIPEGRARVHALQRGGGPGVAKAGPARNARGAAKPSPLPILRCTAQRLNLPASTRESLSPSQGTNSPAAPSAHSPATQLCQQNLQLDVVSECCSVPAAGRAHSGPDENMRVASLLLALAALVVAVSAGTRPANATDLGTGCGVSSHCSEALASPGHSSARPPGREGRSARALVLRLGARRSRAHRQTMANCRWTGHGAAVQLAPLHAGVLLRALARQTWHVLNGSAPLSFVRMLSRRETAPAAAASAPAASPRTTS